MTGTTDILLGKWHELKGKIKEYWHEFTEEDLKSIEGKAENLYGKLQEKYGYTKDKAREEFDKFLKNHDDKSH